MEPLSQLDDADRRTAKYYELKARYEVIMGKKRAKLHNFTHYELTMEHNFRQIHRAEIGL